MGFPGDRAYPRREYGHGYEDEGACFYDHIFPKISIISVLGTLIECFKRYIGWLVILFYGNLSPLAQSGHPV